MKIRGNVEGIGGMRYEVNLDIDLDNAKVPQEKEVPCLNCGYDICSCPKPEPMSRERLEKVIASSVPIEFIQVIEPYARARVYRELATAILAELKQSEENHADLVDRLDKEGKKTEKYKETLEKIIKFYEQVTSEPAQHFAYNTAKQALK